MCIPVILVFVANLWLVLCCGVVDTSDAAVTTGKVGACREFVYTEAKGMHPNYGGVRCKPMASIFDMVL